MADDVQLDLNTTQGAVVRTVQKASVQYPVSILDVGTHPSDNSGSPRLVSKGDNVGMPIEGLANNDDPVQGSPILIGAKYDASPSAVADGDMSVLVVDNNHNLRTTIYGAGTENGISVSAAGAISVDALTKVDFDTSGQTADQACVGLVVPSASGPVAIGSSSIQNKVNSVAQPSVLGVNVSQLGAFFFDGDNNDNADTTNVAAFGIAVASDTGPKAIGSDGSTTTSLPVEGTVTANLGVTDTANLAAIKTAVQTIDNAVSGNEMQVDIVSGSVGITGTTQADITAIKTAVETLDNAISGNEMQVDVVGSLPAGSAVIGNVGLDTTDSTNLAAVKTSVQQIDNAIDGNEMQVDVVGALPVGGNRIGKVQVVTSGDVAVDSFGGGTQYAEDDTVGTAGTGTLQIGIKNTSLSTLSAAEGDAVGIRATAKGAMWVGVDGDVTANLGSTDTANLAAIKTSVQLIDDAVATDKIAIAGRTAISNAATATAILVDAAGHLQVDLASDPTVSIDASANTVKIDGSNNAVSLGTDTVHIAGRTNIADTTTAKALLVDSAGHLQVDVLSGGGNGDHVYVDDADWTASSSKHSLIGGVYQATRGTITDGDTGPVRLTSSGQVHAYLDDVTHTANSAITNPDTSAKVAMVGAVVDESLAAASTPYSEGDAAPLKVTTSGALHVKLPSDNAGSLGAVRIVGGSDDGLDSKMDIDVDENKAFLNATDTTIYGISAFNSTNAPIYLKFWDQGEATVTVGSTTPKLTFLIPANSVSNGAGFVLNVPQGIFFNYQVVWAATTGVDASSSTGPATNGCILNFFYKQQ